MKRGERCEPEISERQLEDDIECALLAYGPDACVADEPAVAEPVAAYGDARSGRLPSPQLTADYDRHRCLIPRDVIDFIYATQPKEWERLKQHHGAEVKEKFIARLSREIERRGTLDVLRKGIKDSGCKFRLAYFRPVSGLNEELRRLYEANLFSVVRQLHYSEQNEKSIDLALFLNGIPLFTAELKNPFNGQNVQDAIKQYRLDRDHREPLLRFRRCLAHFAVDPDLVYVTTELARAKDAISAVQPGQARWRRKPARAAKRGREAWWVRHGLSLGRGLGARQRAEPHPALHPRVRAGRRQGQEDRRAQAHFPALPSDGRGAATRGRCEVAWLGAALPDSALGGLRQIELHRLARPPALGAARRRRPLGLRLGRGDHRPPSSRPPASADDPPVRADLGVVENIDQTSKQLKQALEEGKKIIVTTLQKFPVIADQMGELPGKRFAVIVDEAHSSQSGESTKHLKSVLSADGLDEAERRGRSRAGPRRQDHRRDSHARPASQREPFRLHRDPQAEDLGALRHQGPDGKFDPFSLYSMRQAIEEGFILDVLDNYTTYETYWKLLKKIEDDPRFEKRKAVSLLKSYVDLHPHSIDKKIEIMVDHFHGQVASRIGGKAKAMIVTRSRLHAVRYVIALRKHLEAQGLSLQGAGRVLRHREGRRHRLHRGQHERCFREADRAHFERDEYRFLVVANKFQTGFDQPLLHTMYVDKKLSGVNAVQTLSRLNRTHPEKEDTLVLDFANSVDEIQESFQPYYEKTILSEATDPNLLHDLERELLDYSVYQESDVESFAAAYFRKRTTQAQLYSSSHRSSSASRRLIWTRSESSVSS